MHSLEHLVPEPAAVSVPRTPTKSRHGSESYFDGFYRYPRPLTPPTSPEPQRALPAPLSIPAPVSEEGQLAIKSPNSVMRSMSTCSSCGLPRRMSLSNTSYPYDSPTFRSPIYSEDSSPIESSPKPTTYHHRRLSQQHNDRFCPDTIMPPPPQPQLIKSDSMCSTSSTASSPTAYSPLSDPMRRRHHRRRRSSLCHVENLMYDDINPGRRDGRNASPTGAHNAFSPTGSITDTTVYKTSSRHGCEDDVRVNDRIGADIIARKIVERAERKSNESIDCIPPTKPKTEQNRSP